MLIPNCKSGKDVDILATDTLNRESGTVGPSLIHLSLVHSPEPSVVLCVHYQWLKYFAKLTHC